MKKIIIILILLSMISVIGCSYNPGLIEEQEKIIQDLKREIENLNEQEQEIENLKNQIEDLKFKVTASEVIIEIYRDALEDIREEVDSIEGAVEYLDLGYYTKSEAIDEIYYHASNIEDILEEFNIK